MCLCMANKKKRVNQRFQPLRFIVSHPLGALASVTASIARLLSADLEQNYFVNSVDCTWSIKDFTVAVGDGPILVGFCHNDYSVTEVKEALEVSLLGPANKIEQERQRRLVRIVGIMHPTQESAGLEIDVMNDGKPIRTKLNWMIEEGKSLDLFTYNMGSSVLTTGAILDASGSIYGRWVY